MRGGESVQEPAPLAADSSEGEQLEEKGPRLDFQEPALTRDYLRRVGRYSVKHPLPAVQRERSRLALAAAPDAREMFEIRRAELAEARALEEQAAHEAAIEEER